MRYDALGDTHGLIALTGGPGGPIDRLLSRRRRRSRAAPPRPPRRRSSATGSMSNCSATKTSRANEAALLDLAYGAGLPLVATNEPYFAAASDFEAQDALLCIAEGALITTAERRRLTPQHRFKTPRRNDKTVRRLARGDRQQRRDRAALRLSSAHPQADPAALLACPARRRWTRRRSCAARPPRAWRR